MAILLTTVLAVCGCSTKIGGVPSAASGTGGTGGDAGSSPGAGGQFAPSDENEDPSDDIDGVEKIDYATGAAHTVGDQRVAYDQAPPFGGAHDGVWADCSGIVYDKPVRNENMVHSLEHGAVWLAYHPDEVTGDDLETLEALVDGKPFLMLSPYPNLGTPIALLSWGHRLTIDDPNDERIGQFIEALRQNQYVTPEPNGRCDSQGTGFDVEDPPPFDPSPPGPDALPVEN